MFKKTIIVFVGNDGSGKTYQAKRVFQNLGKDRLSVKLIHFDHFFLRIPKLIESNKYFSTKGEKSQSIKLFRVLRGNVLFGVIFPIIAYLDFLVFYLIKIMFSLEKIIILDRYFYDKLIKFYDLKICSPMLFNLLMQITPVPNATIYLDLGADVSFKRKKELTISILNNRRILYKKISGGFHFITINAEGDKREILSKILGKIKLVFKE